MMTQVYLWLDVLSKQKLETMPLFQPEFKQLTKLVPVEASRVIKNTEGEPRVFFVDRIATINLLKNIYGFHTKSEAGEILNASDI